MAKQEDSFKNVISHAKEYGYIFASSEIYDGLSAVYDYGQNGAELKKNIKEYWWKSMVQLHQNIVGIDIKPEFPKKPNIVITNSFDKPKQKIALQIIKRIKEIII